MVHDDDYYKKSEEIVTHEKKKKRQRSFFCSCLEWESDTWYGLGAIFSGMMLQAALGMASIWGNIVIYVTSKLRGHDP